MSTENNKTNKSNCKETDYGIEGGGEPTEMEMVNLKHNDDNGHESVLKEADKPKQFTTKAKDDIDNEIKDNVVHVLNEADSGNDYAE